MKRSAEEMEGINQEQIKEQIALIDDQIRKLSKTKQKEQRKKA